MTKAKAKTSPQPSVAAIAAEVATEPDFGPTVGQILGMPMPPRPGFAVMADDPSELTDPRAQEHRPGENEPPPPRPAEKPGTGPLPREGDAPAEPYNPPPPDRPGPAGKPFPDPIAAENAAQAAAQAAREAHQEALSRERERVYAAQRQRHGLPATQAPITPADADFEPGSVRYESRISIVDAFRYPGSLTLAPAWVDRNWAGYGDDDVLRNIPAGPCLRVPSSADPANVVLARIGDYVCRQSVVVEDGLPPVMRVEVWTGEQFVRLFMPVKVSELMSSPATGPKVTSSRQQKPSKSAASRRAA